MSLTKKSIYTVTVQTHEVFQRKNTVPFMFMVALWEKYQLESQYDWISTIEYETLSSNFSWPFLN